MMGCPDGPYRWQASSYSARGVRKFGERRDLVGAGLPAMGPALSEQNGCGGNISYLARRLGVSRNTLYKRLRQTE
ncbi:helix-turn-helix domain-containing protein [Pseudomonas sp. Irchel s3f7]|uniref:helix-turn-helix domain-containing protein n=1 Tax=Pseudomonas sp. C32 TaxID=1529208 RepID=UPI000BA304FA